MSGPRNALLRERLDRLRPKSGAIVAATELHGIELAQVMRPEDQSEVFASGGYSPLEAIEKSLEQSIEAFSLILDDRVVAMFGVGQYKAGTVYGEREGGVIWLLCSIHVERYKTTLVKQAPKVLDWMLERYPVLVNAIDARYTSALHWAQKLGFTIGEPKPFGQFRLPFHSVHIKRRGLRVERRRAEASSLIVGI